MTPGQCISALDRALAMCGEDVIVRRTVGSTNVDVKCRATVNAVGLENLSAGVIETDQHVIMSMTQIREAGWPNQPIVTTRPFNPDPGLPTVYDNIIIQGRMRNIAFVDAHRVDNIIVRLNMRVTG